MIGGFKIGMEVGIAQGRYSELFLSTFKQQSSSSSLSNITWYMCDPSADELMGCRYPPVKSSFKCNHSELNWFERNIITLNSKIKYYKMRSTDEKFINKIKNVKFDFIYLDGAHDYRNVKIELQLLWPFIKSGGVLAGMNYILYFLFLKFIIMIVFFRYSSVSIHHILSIYFSI